MQRNAALALFMMLAACAVRADIAPDTPESRAYRIGYSLITSTEELQALRASQDANKNKKKMDELELARTKAIQGLNGSQRAIVVKQLQTLASEHEKAVREGGQGANDSKKALAAVQEVLELLDKEKTIEKKSVMFTWITAVSGLLMAAAIAGAVLALAKRTGNQATSDEKPTSVPSA